MTYNKTGPLLEDPSELLYGAEACETPAFAVIKQEDQKKWTAYLENRHQVDHVIYYGKAGQDLTIIASGYARPSQYGRFTDETDRDEETHAFVVSMECLVGVSSHWELLLNGLTGVVDTACIQVISLPVLSVEAFSILLSIAHGQPEKVPKKLELSTLALVGKASIQYSMLSLLQPWVDNWVARLESELDQSSEDAECQDDFVTIYWWIWVSYAFGLTNVMSSMTFKMAYTTKWIGRRSMLPPTVYDHIYRIRANYLAHVTRQVYEYHNGVKGLLGVMNRSAIPCEVCASGSPLCIKGQHDILVTWFKALRLPLYKFNDDIAAKVLPAAPTHLVNSLSLVPSGPRSGLLCKGTRRRGCGLWDVAKTLPRHGEEHLMLAQYTAAAGRENPVLKPEQIALMARRRAILEKD